MKKNIYKTPEMARHALPIMMGRRPHFEITRSTAIIHNSSIDNNNCSRHGRLLLKLDKHPYSYLLVEFLHPMRHKYCPTPTPLENCTPPPPSPMPHLLQEMASRWCPGLVCLILTIEVFAAYYSCERTKVFGKMRCLHNRGCY